MSPGPQHYSVLIVLAGPRRVEGGAVSACICTCAQWLALSLPDSGEARKAIPFYRYNLRSCITYKLYPLMERMLNLLLSKRLLIKKLEMFMEIKLQEKNQYLVVKCNPHLIALTIFYC